MLNSFNLKFAFLFNTLLPFDSLLLFISQFCLERSLNLLVLINNLLLKLLKSHFCAVIITNIHRVDKYRNTIMLWPLCSSRFTLTTCALDRYSITKVDHMLKMLELSFKEWLFTALEQTRYLFYKTLLSMSHHIIVGYGGLIAFLIFTSKLKSS